MAAENNGKVLVVGGAGYIGSHTCLALHGAGYEPVVYDNLSNGNRSSVRWGGLIVGDIRDGKAVEEAVSRVGPRAIIHFAGLIEVGRSVEDPLSYHDVNVGGSINVVKAASGAGIPLVFSSTCATFGIPARLPMDEYHPQNPLNPYGQSKLAVERMIADVSAAGALRGVVLRYFNAAGAADAEGIGEAHDPETHAIPLILASLRRGEVFRVFGDDYPTPDGTCVRDYVHVLDLAAAHVLAMEYLLGGGASDTFNLGTGWGTSVLELVRTIAEVTGLDPVLEVHGRRAGDAPYLVADSSKASAVLGWSPSRDLGEIVRSAAAWHGVIK